MIQDEPIRTAVAAALLAEQAKRFSSAGEDPMSPAAVAGGIAASLLGGIHGAQAAAAACAADPDAFVVMARALAFEPLHDDVEAMRTLLVRYGWTEPGSQEADPYVGAARAGLLTEIF